MPKLTQAALRRLIKKTGRHSDGGGLYFRVIGEGKVYFVYRYRVGGKERETSLGPFPELTLAEAREKHAALRKRVVVDRADPLAEKRGAKTMQAVKAVPTGLRRAKRTLVRRRASRFRSGNDLPSQRHATEYANSLRARLPASQLADRR